MKEYLTRLSERRTPLVFAGVSLAFQTFSNFWCLGEMPFLLAFVFGLCLLIWPFLAQRFETLHEAIAILLSIGIVVPITYPLLGVACAFATYE